MDNEHNNGIVTPPGQRKRKKAGTPSAHVPGPAPFEITDDHLRQIEALSGYGLTNNAIAHIIGIAPRTFRKKKREDYRIRAALEKGKAIARSHVAKALYVKATSGELGAIVWWEKTRAGMSERQIIAHEDVPAFEVVREADTDDDGPPDDSDVGELEEDLEGA